MVYDHYLQARTQDGNVEIFARRFGNEFEGTRGEDTRKIIRWIRDAEKRNGGAYTGPRNPPTANPSQSSCTDARLGPTSPRPPTLVTPSRQAASVQPDQPSIIKTLSLGNLVLGSPIGSPMPIAGPRARINVSPARKVFTPTVKVSRPGETSLAKLHSLPKANKSPRKVCREGPARTYNNNNNNPDTRPPRANGKGSLNIRPSPHLAPADTNLETILSQVSKPSGTSSLSVNNTQSKSPVSANMSAARGDFGWTRNLELEAKRRLSVFSAQAPLPARKRLPDAGRHAAPVAPQISSPREYTQPSSRSGNAFGASSSPGFGTSSGFSAPRSPVATAPAATQAQSFAVAPPTGPKGMNSGFFAQRAPVAAPAATQAQNFGVAPPTVPKADRPQQSLPPIDADCYRPTYPDGFDPRYDSYDQYESYRR